MKENAHPLSFKNSKMSALGCVSTISGTFPIKIVQLDTIQIEV